MFSNMIDQPACFPSPDLLSTHPFAADVDALAPSWMGDSGFNDDFLAVWRKAESQFDIKNNPPKPIKDLKADRNSDDFEKQVQT